MSANTGKGGLVMSRLTGKIALITGGGGGIGRATALRFAEEGAKVVVAEIDRALGAETAQLAKAAAGNSGGDALFVATDVTDRASVANAVATTVEAFGGLNVLHNNAGGSTLQDGPVTEAPEEEFWRVIKVDLYGTFLCSQLAIPEIIKAGGGSVINMASNVALMALPGRDCYTAAKGGIASIEIANNHPRSRGIASMTRSMAVEYAPHKIRVNAIAPSVTLSDRVKKLLAGSSEIKAVGDQHLLGLGEPLDIAHMAVYLAANESRITTGQVLSVDSGVTIY